jgi:hypothetical protein
MCSSHTYTAQLCSDQCLTFEFDCHKHKSSQVDLCGSCKSVNNQVVFQQNSQELCARFYLQDCLCGRSQKWNAVDVTAGVF